MDVSNAVHGFRRVRLALSTLAFLAVAVSAPAQARNKSPTSTNHDSTRIASPASVEITGLVARSRFNYLARRSATMQQMLAVLDATPAISVRLRETPTIKRQEHGHGTLLVEGTRIRAFLEFDAISATILQQLEAVAHEIAHVVEVACLGPINASVELRTVLRARGFSVHLAQGAVAVETPFARAAGREVIAEALPRRTAPGKLPELAARYRLGSPCVDEASRIAITSAAR